MSKIANTVRSFVREDEGATMVEYGLMVALIAIVCIVAVTSLGTKTSAVFQGAADKL